MTAWHPHHIAERYGLFTIIVLGECVLATNVALQVVVEDTGWDLDLLLVGGGGLCPAVRPVVDVLPQGGRRGAGPAPGAGLRVGLRPLRDLRLAGGARRRASRSPSRRSATTSRRPTSWWRWPSSCRSPLYLATVWLLHAPLGGGLPGQRGPDVGGHRGDPGGRRAGAARAAAALGGRPGRGSPGGPGRHPPRPQPRPRPRSTSAPAGGPPAPARPPRAAGGRSPAPTRAGQAVGRDVADQHRRRAARRDGSEGAGRHVGVHPGRPQRADRRAGAPRAGRPGERPGRRPRRRRTCTPTTGIAVRRAARATMSSTTGPLASAYCCTTSQVRRARPRLVRSYSAAVVRVGAQVVAEDQHPVDLDRAEREDVQVHPRLGPAAAAGARASPARGPAACSRQRSAHRRTTPRRPGRRRRGPGRSPAWPRARAPRSTPRARPAAPGRRARARTSATSRAAVAGQVGSASTSSTGASRTLRRPDPADHQLGLGRGGPARPGRRRRP